jgi:hypothetical protein
MFISYSAPFLISMSIRCPCNIIFPFLEFSRFTFCIISSSNACVTLLIFDFLLVKTVEFARVFVSIVCTSSF